MLKLLEFRFVVESCNSQTGALGQNLPFEEIGHVPKFEVSALSKVFDHI